MCPDLISGSFLHLYLGAWSHRQSRRGTLLFFLNTPNVIGFIILFPCHPVESKFAAGLFMSSIGPVCFVPMRRRWSRKEPVSIIVTKTYTKTWLIGQKYGIKLELAAEKSIIFSSDFNHNLEKWR